MKLINLISVLIVIPTLVFAGPKEDAFNSGSSTGSSSNQGIIDKISNPKGYDVIPGYDVGAPAVSSEFANGYGSPIGSAVNKVATCRALSSTAPAAQKAECEVLLYTVDNPASRPQFTIGDTDPLRAIKDAALTDPEAIAGSITGTYSDCATVTATTPDQTYYEYCDESAAKGETNECPVVLEIETASTYTYECNANPNQLNEYNCNKNLNIIVTQPPDVYNFTPGAQTAYFSRMDRCSWMDHYIAWGYYGSNDSYLRVKWWEADHTNKWVNMPMGQKIPIYSHTSSWQDWEMGVIDSNTLSISGKYYCSGNSCYLQGMCERESWQTDMQGRELSRNVAVYDNVVVGFPRATITPQNPYISSENWDNQCSALEARAQ